jgi:hypothetical protein
MGLVGLPGVSSLMAFIFLGTDDCPRLGVARFRVKREAYVERRKASKINNNKNPRRGGA